MVRMKNKEVIEPVSGPVEQEKNKKREAKKKNVGLEILRFIVVGVICTLIDFAVNLAVVWLLAFLFNNHDQVTSLIIVGIATATGFLVSCIVNFFLSKCWVYQNVDKKVYEKKGKLWWKYLAFAFGGWVLGIGIMVVCVLLAQNSTGALDFAYKIFVTDWKQLFAEGGKIFWLYVAFFGIKTIVVLVYNYLTRKFFIFKKPKAEPVAMSQPVRYITRPEIEAIVRAEVHEHFKGQDQVSKRQATAIVDEEIDKAMSERKDREMAEANGDQPVEA